MYDTDSSGQGVARIVFLDAGTASSAIAFVTEQGNSIGERMRIDSAGNVGIGTDSPASKLDVAGDIESSGSSFGLVLTSADGSRWRQTISNTGVPVYTQL